MSGGGGAGGRKGGVCGEEGAGAGQGRWKACGVELVYRLE